MMTELSSRIFLGPREITVGETISGRTNFHHNQLYGRFRGRSSLQDKRYMSCPCFDSVGGRLARFTEAWNCLTSDAWVLQTACQGLR